MDEKYDYILEGRRKSNEYIQIGSKHDTKKGAVKELRAYLTKHDNYWEEVRVIRRVKTYHIAISPIDTDNTYERLRKD